MNNMLQRKTFYAIQYFPVSSFDVDVNPSLILLELRVSFQIFSFMKIGSYFRFLSKNL